MNIIFMGTPDFAVPALEKLHSDQKVNVVAVYTQPPAKAGRGMNFVSSPVEIKAKDLGLLVFTPDKLNSEEEIKKIRKLNPDLIIVAAYGLILKQVVLDIPKYGCINIHPSLLPRWRGAAPIERTIENGDKETGVCTMQMDSGLDTGDILLSQKLSLNGSETASDLIKITSEIGAKLLIETIRNIKSIKNNPQTNIGMTYASKIVKHEGLINWENSAQDIYNKIRAFDIWPNCWFNFKDTTIKIHEAKVIDENSTYSPGTIINNKMHIQTGKGIIEPLKLQKPGKKITNVKDFLNGFKISPGDRI